MTPGQRAALRGAIYVDDVVPVARLGAGTPRAMQILRVLASLADDVLVVPTTTFDDGGAPPSLPTGVSVSTGHPGRALADALGTGRYALVWAGRPYNMQLVERVQRLKPSLFDGVRIVYDAEAVFAMRDASQRALHGQPMSEVQLRRAIRQELFPAEIAHAAAAVSDAERALLAERLRCPVVRLAYPAPIVDTSTPFAQRRGLLFVGPASGGAESPNGDALRWLFEHVRRDRAVAALPVTVAGRETGPAGWLGRYAATGVELRGVVDDLVPLYAAARVFVAPTRFAAGIPLKVLDAARHGVPVVATPLIAAQLSWRPGVEIAVGETPEAFAREIVRLHEDEAQWRAMRDAAFAALARDAAPAAFDAAAAALALGTGPGAPRAA